METLLPSEIARLVVGYLEDEKCDKAARTFLETSPHLQECRMIAAKGKTFRKVVYEMTLIDILDKYCSIYAIVQERLNKVADCDQVKQCGDFLEQLRFLIEGSRSQRFVVNINVPSQNSAPTSGGSPIISSSIRKRQRSGSDRDRDRDRCKRFAKSHPHSPDKHSISENIHCDRVEATPAESLPGHIDSTKSILDERSSSLQQKSKEVHFRQNESHDSELRFYMPGFSTEQAEVIQDLNKNHEKGNSEENNRIFSTSPAKCSMSTNTEVSDKNYQNTGTSPWEQMLDFEVNEPLESLSLLGKELLYCKELHEQIADNINKSGLLPTDSTYKDDAFNANTCGFNNSGIFKSIVEETMVTDSFQQFVGSILKITDSNTVNDLESRNNLEVNEKEQPQEPYQNNVNEILSIADKIGDPTENALKGRNSRKQNSRSDSESNNEVDDGNIINALNDQNNAAIQSIINANSANIEEKTTNVEQATKSSRLEIKNKNSAENVPEELNNSIEIIDPPIEINKPKVTVAKSLNNSKEHKTSRRKEKKPVKKVSCEIIDEKIVTPEMMVTSTLVVCSKDEPGSFLGVQPSYPTANLINPQFVPIAPKHQFRREPVYFKTVNVPQRITPAMKKKSEALQKQNSIPLPTTHPVKVSLPQTVTHVGLPISTPLITLSEEKVSSSHTDFRVQHSLPSITINSQEDYTTNVQTEIVQNQMPNTDNENFKPSNVDVNIEVPKIIVQNVKESTAQKSNTEPPSENNPINLEQITLYGNENSSAAFLGSQEIGTLNVDASMSFSLSGLSPFLKMNRVQCKDSEMKETLGRENVAPIEKVSTKNITNVPSSLADAKKSELITKRTPKSIIKSRSKNHRLSLSTPRRRNSHVRALDFGTPPKSSNSASKSASKTSPVTLNRSKSHCRTSLFKSPPFVNSSQMPQKDKSPTKDYNTYKVPIATRSPAPKLMGGWEKFTGMDMILGKVSPNDNSNSASGEKTESNPQQQPPKVLKSWDTELRLALNSGPPLLKSGENKKEKSSKTSRKSKKEKPSPVLGKKKKAQPKKESKKNSSKTLNTPAKDKELTNEDLPSTDLPCKDLPSKDLPSKDLSSKDLPSKDESLALNVSDSKNLTTFFPSDKSISFSLDDTDVPPSNSKLLETPETDPKPVENLPSVSSNKRVDVKIVEKKSGEIVKKYAQLLTVPRSETQVNSEFMKTSPNYSKKLIQIPNMMDLETPRKLENSKDIPPTPRFLSPNSSSITPFTKVSRNDDSSKIPDFFPTPDFAPTPGIKLTPNLAGENTKDAIKKGEFSSCSPYYQPSSETAEGSEKLKIQSKNITKVAEFQVIKVNLPREEAAKEELVISSSSIEISESVTVGEEINIPVKQGHEVSTESTADKSSQESDSESSDSDSDTSSSHSSSSSSSSSRTSSDSSNSSASDTLPPSAKKNPDCSDKSSSDSSNDSFQLACVEEIDEVENIQNPTGTDEPLINSQESEKIIPENQDSEIQNSVSSVNNSDPTTNVNNSDHTSNVNHLDPTSNVNNSDPTYNVNNSDHTSNVNHLDPTSNVNNSDPTSNVNKTDPISNINNAVQVSEIQDHIVDETKVKDSEMKDTVNDVEMKDSINVVKMKDTINVVEMKDTINVVEMKDTINVVEMKDTIRDVEMKDTINVVEMKDTIRDVEMKDTINNVEMKDTVNDIEMKDTINDVEKKNVKDVAIREKDVETKNVKKKRFDMKLKKINFVKAEIKEASPKKMFSVTNVEGNEDQETPAKNDLLIEATISETPSSSKAGTDITINLSTKISEIMTSEKQLSDGDVKSVATNNLPSKPKIMSIERIDPINSLKVANILNNTDNRSGLSLQARANAIDHDKLRMQLESKRERLKEAFCEATRGRGKARGRGGNLSIKRARYQVMKKAVVLNTSINSNINNPSVSKDISKSNEGKPDIEMKNVEKLVTKHAKSKKVEKIDEKVEREIVKEASAKKSSPNVKKGKTAKKTKVTKTKTEKKINIVEDKKLPETVKVDKNDKLETVSKTKEKDGSANAKLKEIISSVEDEKCAMKAKVDMVKRDLFSDDEAVDQRTTRSKTRQSSDTQKSDSSDHNFASTSEKSSKESLPCVLQSLDLVPTNKSEINDISSGCLNTTDSRQAEFHFVYDEATAVKKRRRKYSFNDMEIHVNDKNGERCKITISVTPLEEIFSLSPKPKKRTAKKTPVKNIKKVVEAGENYEKPLAASSPIFKAAQSSSKSIISTKNDEAAKTERDKNDKCKTMKKEINEKEKPKSKSRKRKISTTEDPEHGKSKLSAPENLALLENMEVEKLLSYIHGPH